MPGIPLPPDSQTYYYKVGNMVIVVIFYANNFGNFLIVIKSLKNDVNPHQYEKSETTCTI